MALDSVCDFDSCTGCMLCVNICPKNSIIIEEGLLSYKPIINNVTCIDCGLCKKKCPVLAQRELIRPILWKQGWAEEEIRNRAASGGAASAIMKGFLNSGGYVASCYFKEGIFGFHVTDNWEEACKFAGSKYVKSNPGFIYKEINELLAANQKVLFIGLPCQSAAVQNICNKHDNLYTVDLICHGTPSSKLLKQFLTECGYEWDKISTIKFRDENIFGISVDGKRIVPHSIIDSYTRLFLHGVDYTENCYSCRYATLNRVSDVTLGDAWGQLSDTVSGGVSLVLCQTEKGINLLENSGLLLKEVDLDRAIEANQQLNCPSRKHSSRGIFFNEVNKGRSIRRATVKALPKESIKQILKMGLNKMRIIGK